MHAWPRIIGLYLILTLSLCGCGGASRTVNTLEAHRLTIVHTNDHHGHFWRSSKGEGGMAARQTLIEQIRTAVTSEGGHLLVLDAGDINTGVPESDMLLAQPDIQGMNLMGYDAMTLGNHEFDKPLAMLEQQRAWARFPFLSANIYTADGKRLATPYIIREYNGLRVAIFGLTTENTVYATSPQITGALTFRPAVDEARELVPKLRSQADVVIALTHLGLRDFDTESTSTTLAEKVPGIDLIVDGHSHTELHTPLKIGETYIVQAGDHGRYLGRVDVEHSLGQTRLRSGALVPVNLSGNQTIAENPTMLALLEPFQAAGGEKLGQPVGTTVADFVWSKEIIRSQPTPLGRLCAMAVLEKTKAHVAVINGGGIRAGFSAGTISYRDILSVRPFGNTICTVPLSGADLRAYLLHAAATNPGSGGFPQYAGVRPVTPGAKEIRFDDDSILRDAATYVLAVESFVASGGDKYPVLTDRPGFTDTGYMDADVLREYIATHSPLNPADYAAQN